MSWTVSLEVDSLVLSCPESGTTVWQINCSLRLKAGHLKHIVSNKQAHTNTAQAHITGESNHTVHSDRRMI